MTETVDELFNRIYRDRPTPTFTCCVCETKVNGRGLWFVEKVDAWGEPVTQDGARVGGYVCSATCRRNVTNSTREPETSCEG